LELGEESLEAAAGHRRQPLLARGDALRDGGPQHGDGLFVYGGQKSLSVGEGLVEVALREPCLGADAPDGGRAVAHGADALEPGSQELRPTLLAALVEIGAAVQSPPCALR